MLGQQPPHVPRILTAPIDITRPRRDLILRQTTNQITEIQKIPRDVVQVSAADGMAHEAERIGMGLVDLAA
jgi:hypothetical protein